MNVTLIGMPGAGKSHVGKRLAETLGFAFVEPDALLEREFGMPLQAVLERLGREEFLRKEAEVTMAHANAPHGLVLAPGGSIVYREDAMAHLKAISTVVYLRASLETVALRIGKVRRGIVGGGNSLETLFTERLPLYRRWADVTVDAEEDADAVATAIHRELTAAPMPAFA